MFAAEVWVPPKAHYTVTGTGIVPEGQLLGMLFVFKNEGMPNVLYT